MKISAIIAALKPALDTWAKARQTTVILARDPWHAYEIIASGTSGFMIVLGVGSEELIDSPRQHPLARPTIEITLGNGMGLTADTGAAVLQTTGQRVALVDELDSMIEAVYAVTLPEDGKTSRIFEYSGFDTLSLPNGLRMAAYRTTFRITRQVLEA